MDPMDPNGDFCKRLLKTPKAYKTITTIYIIFRDKKWTPFRVIYIEMLMQHYISVFCQCLHSSWTDFCCLTTTKQRGKLVGPHDAQCVQRSCPGCGGVGFGFQCAPYCLMCLLDTRPTIFCKNCRLYVH